MLKIKLKSQYLASIVRCLLQLVASFNDSQRESQRIFAWLMSWLSKMMFNESGDDLTRILSVGSTVINETGEESKWIAIWSVRTRRVDSRIALAASGQEKPSVFTSAFLNLPSTPPLILFLVPAAVHEWVSPAPSLLFRFARTHYHGPELLTTRSQLCHNRHHQRHHHHHHHSTAVTTSVVVINAIVKFRCAILTRETGSTGFYLIACYASAPLFNFIFV